MEEGDHLSSRPPLPCPPASASSAIVPSSPLTYVVQIPKDQIYRVPPPENARLAEQYRSELASDRRQRAPCLHLFSRCLLISAFVAVTLLVAALIFYLVVRPAAPVFHVNHFDVEKTHFDLSASVANPSNAMGYLLEGGGTAELDHLGKIVAKGDPPRFYLKAEESRTFRLDMRWTGKAAEHEMLLGSNAVALRLTVAAPVRLGLGSLRLWEMKLKVDCELTVKSLGMKARVSSQDCKTKVEI